MIQTVVFKKNCWCIFACTFWIHSAEIVRFRCLDHTVRAVIQKSHIFATHLTFSVLVGTMIFDSWDTSRYNAEVASFIRYDLYTVQIRMTCICMMSLLNVNTKYANYALHSRQNNTMRYWPSVKQRFSSFLLKHPKRTGLISSHLDRTSLVYKRFIILKTYFALVNKNQIWLVCRQSRERNLSQLFLLQK